MSFNSFVLSAIKHFRGNVGSELSCCFVQLLAPLTLRTLRCIEHQPLAHNKAQQYAPGGAGPSLRSRRCARRYGA